MRFTTRPFALLGLIPLVTLSSLATLGACSSTLPPPTTDEHVGGTEQAMGGTEGTFEYALDAPWRMEPMIAPIYPPRPPSYAPIPIQISIHDVDHVADDTSVDWSASSYKPTMGNVCELAVTEGDVRTAIPTEQFAEIERTMGDWLWPGDGQPNGPPHDSCTSSPSTTINCAIYRGLAGTSEWHATALYTSIAKGAGSNIPLTLDLKVSRTPSIDCSDNDASHFYTLRNYVRVHLGEASLPRFSGGWSYGDVHYHSQGTDNEGESAYNYRGVTRAMTAVGLDFLWATEHASASNQIVDTDLEGFASGKTLKGKVTRGSLRDMDVRRFKAYSALVAQANRDSALRAPPPNVLALGFNNVIPQIWLGGEVDVIPETRTAQIPWGAGKTFDVASNMCGGWQSKVKSCTGGLPGSEVIDCSVCLSDCSTCDQGQILVDAPESDGTMLVRDVQGLNDETNFGREHMVYLPDPTRSPASAFVPSATSSFGGATRRLNDMLGDVQAKGGSVFLAHHLNAPDGSSGPDGPPWSPAMLDKAFRSQAVLGLEFWNEDTRRESHVLEKDAPPNIEIYAGYENGFQRNDIFQGTDLLMSDNVRQGLAEGSDGKFELYPFDTKNGRFEKVTTGVDTDLTDGSYSWDTLNLRGLDPNQTSSADFAWLPAGQPRKMFMAGGSDAHGDFNYRRVGYMTGSSGVSDTAIGLPRNLVLTGAPTQQVAPGTRLVNSPGQALSALRAGHFSVTDGAALRIVYDQNRNGVIDPTDPMMGDTIDLAGQTTMPLLVEWATTSEFGTVDRIELTVGVLSTKTGQSRLYAGGDGTIPTTTALASTYSDGGWDYGVTDRGYWRASPAAGSPEPAPLSLSAERLDAACPAPCLSGVHAFTLDLARLHVAPGLPAERLFVRAFAANDELAALNPVEKGECAQADSFASQVGRCIRRYAFTNPIWATHGPSPIDASYPGYGDNALPSFPADYDGDGQADLSAKDAAGKWYIDYARNGLGAWDEIHAAYGGPTSRPTPGDYDGDGMTDLSVKDDGGTWFFDYAKNGFGTWDDEKPGFGDSWFMPYPADYDGDGITDVSTKDGNGNWYLDYAKNGFGVWDEIKSGYGDASVHPVPADYDGDGKADLSIKTDAGEWRFDYASDGFNGWNKTVTAYGPAWYEPVPADYDGDGKADLAVHSGDGAWFIDYSANGIGGWDVWGIPGYGHAGSFPAPRDFDGDGKADLAVHDADGSWRIDYAWNGFGVSANVARGATVTASSSYEAQPWSTAYVVDGQESSSNGADGWSSWSNRTVNHTESLELDLPAKKTFNMIALHPRTDSGLVGEGFPIDFKVQVWNGATWIDRVSVSAHPKPDTIPQVFHWAGSDSTDKIRIVGTNLRQVGTDGYVMQLGEVELYATSSANADALGRGLVASVRASSSYEGSSWAKVDVADGRTDSVYGTSMGYASQVGRTVNHHEWVELRFPTRQTFSKVILYPRADAGTAGRGFPVDFKIQVWDGAKWIDRVTRSGYPTPAPTSAPQVFTWGASDTTDRVRLFATGLSVVSQQYLLQLAEMQVAP